MIKIEDIKPGYKKTPAGIIPEDWEVMKLDRLGEFKNGINKSKEDFGKGIPFVNLNDIFNLSFENLQLVNASKSEIENYSLKKGDVLFVRSSVKPEGVGLTNVISEDLEETVYSGFIIRFRSNDTLNLNYKRHCFYNSHFRNRLIAKSTVSANTNINQQALRSLSLVIPPFLEQKAIADCLSTWDKAIEKQTQLIQAKKEFKKGLMQGFFNGQLSVVNEQGTMNNEQLRIVKAKEGEDFTEDWEDVKLGIHFKERKETGFNDKELLSIGEDGVYPQSESNKKDTSNANKSKYKLIKPGDIGYNTMRLWQGRCALSSLEGIVSPAYTILKPVSSRTVPEFFAYYFKMGSVIHKFYRNSQGMVSDTLQCRYKDFKNIKIRVPSFEGQTNIAQVLQIVDQEIELLENKLDQLQLQKKGLMQVLLTGEKRLV